MLNVRFYLILVALSLTLTAKIYAEEPSQPKKRYLMAILGDSISAASLAQTNVQRETVNDLLGRINQNLEDIYEMSKEIQHGNIPFYENKGTLSWGSGTAVASHFKKLKLWFWKYDPEAILTVKNYAVPGSVSDDLKSQVTLLKADLATGHFDELVYVGLTIGANDACSTETYNKKDTYFEGTPNNRFRSNLEDFMHELSNIKQNHPVRVLFHSIPKIPDLGFPQVMDYRSNNDGFSCRFVRKHVFTYCPVLPFWKTDEEYHAYSQIVVDKNDIIRDVIHNSNRKQKQVQGFFSTSMFETDIAVKILAIDCFHPNHHAQESLSESSFEEQPWYRFHGGKKEE